MNHELDGWLRARGVRHQTIPKEPPHSNGVVERMNRTLQDRARWMIMGAGLGMGFRVEAISTASYIRIRGPIRDLSKNPDELWSGITPTVKYLKAYGGKAYMSLEKHKKRGKMGTTKWEGVVVGYSVDNIVYRV